MQFAAAGFRPRRRKTLADDLRRLELQTGHDDAYHRNRECAPRQIDRESLESHARGPLDYESQRARRTPSHHTRKCDAAAAADAAATVIANAVNADHSAIERQPARALDPDSDLGELLVTTNVGTLPPTAFDRQLRSGVMPR